MVCLKECFGWKEQEINVDKDGKKRKRQRFHACIEEEEKALLVWLRYSGKSARYLTC